MLKNRGFDFICSSCLILKLQLAKICEKNNILFVKLFEIYPIYKQEV